MILKFLLTSKGLSMVIYIISSALKNPLIQSNIKVNGFSILGGDYGDVSVDFASGTQPSKVADINASNNLNGMRNIDINGYL